MTTTTIAALTLSATLASPVSAPPAQADPLGDQDADAAALVDEGPISRHYKFDGDQLTGEVLKPDGTMIMHRRAAKHPSLISVRDHFLPELMALALNI